MNKFEKLIEYIINDEDSKARELFHDIVVERSRDIYESIMDEEAGSGKSGKSGSGKSGSGKSGSGVMEASGSGASGSGKSGSGKSGSGVAEGFGGDNVEHMVDELTDEEAMGEDEGSEEFDLTGGDDGAVDGGLPAGGDMGMDGDSAEHAEIEDTVLNIDSKIDELLAKFDDIMGSGTSGTSGSAPSGFSGKSGSAKSGVSGKSGSGSSGSGLSGTSGTSGDSGAMGGGDDFAFESGNPFAKGSGKSGTSGASGSAKSGVSGKSGSGKNESKSVAQMMREYVDKIGDVYGGAGDASEGDAVGASGKKTSVNDKSIVGPGADFGGKTATPKGGNQNQDGTSPTKANNEYNKGQGEIKSGNVNVPGGKAGKTGFKTKEGDYSTEHGNEGQTTDGKVPVSTKSVQTQNTGRK